MNRFSSGVFSVGAQVFFCLATTVLLLISGCGGESVPEEYSGPPSVSGTVTLDGVPVAAAMVSFETSESVRFQAITEASGQFAFESEEITPPLGKYLVRITRSAGSGVAGSESDSLPARYNSKTELIVDVLSGQNSIDFPLTTASEEDDTDE